uniref:LHFPL tetraspan subfamily member 5 protein-like n=1 Tax=Myxine glutinosa TaxID=7769 RepID=UPI00358E6352
MLDVSNAAEIYHTSYVRNARAIGVLWAVLTLCFAVLCVVSFVQPFWIGDTDRSPQAGHFGLARYCLGDAVTQGLVCHGGFLDFSSVPSGAFKTAAFFVGTAMLLVLTSLVCLSLFFFCTAAAVYKVCAWLQLAAAALLVLGCMIYPDGWDAPQVQQTCGAGTDKYHLGQCSVGYAYLIAILGILDAMVLSLLAFVLGNRQDRLLPEDFEPEPRDGAV